MPQSAEVYDKVMDLAKRRGFFWPSFELYGGVGGFIDYGPLGALLKRRIEEKWIDFFVRREGLLLIDTPIINPAPVFDASGHTAHFTDPIAACKRCNRKWRADHLLEEQAKISAEGLGLEELGRRMSQHNVKCPECGGEMEGPQPFNELFKTTIGPYGEDVGYARPETAQGIFINFKRLQELNRGRFPFGVAQVGRCLRNEIAPRQGPIRLRELTIMELEFFFDGDNPRCDRIGKVEGEVLRLLPEAQIGKGEEEPLEVSTKEALERGIIKAPWNAYFMAKAKRFLVELGIPERKQYFKEKLASERAHYSAQTFDQVVGLSRWGYVEVSGHAWRTDYDLKMHIAQSGEDLRTFTPTGEVKKIKRLVAVPDKKALAASFGEKTLLVSRLLQTVDPQRLREALEREGRFSLGGVGGFFEVLAGHVQWKEVEEEVSGRRFIAHVAEPSFGLDRIFYAVLENSYSEKEDRAVLSLPRDIAPIQALVFPLVARDGLAEKALEVKDVLMGVGLGVEFDESGSIGRRYSRGDEAGVPVALTIDYQTLRDGTVTLRDRDTWAQVRAKIEDLPSLLSRYMRGDLRFEELGAPLKAD